MSQIVPVSKFVQNFENTFVLKNSEAELTIDMYTSDLANLLVLLSLQKEFLFFIDILIH